MQELVARANGFVQMQIAGPGETDTTATATADGRSYVGSYYYWSDSLGVCWDGREEGAYRPLVRARRVPRPSLDALVSTNAVADSLPLCSSPRHDVCVPALHIRRGRAGQARRLRLDPVVLPASPSPPPAHAGTHPCTADHRRVPRDAQPDHAWHEVTVARSQRRRDGRRVAYASDALACAHAARHGEPGTASTLPSASPPHQPLRRPAARRAPFPYFAHVAPLHGRSARRPIVRLVLGVFCSEWRRRALPLRQRERDERRRRWRTRRRLCPLCAVADRARYTRARRQRDEPREHGRGAARCECGGGAAGARRGGGQAARAEGDAAVPAR